jgi:hypothetical protein
MPAGNVYCKDCAPLAEKQRHQAYNNNRRDKREQHFYKSRQWRELVKVLASRYHGLCVVSYVIDHRIVPYQTMHHIIPIKDDWSRRLDTDCIIPLSESWHQRVESAYRNGLKAETQKELFEALRRFRYPGGG